MCACVRTRAHVCGICVVCVCVHDMFVHAVCGVGGYVCMYVCMRYLCICMYIHGKSPGVHEGIAFSRGK